MFFGDFEQAIFSFLGASTENFAMETSDCVRHYFRKNFRATPLLLEILMRYSLEVLHSSWEFLPEPSDANAKNGVMELSEEKLELGKSGIDGDFDFRKRLVIFLSKLAGKEKSAVFDFANYLVEKKDD